MINRHRVGWGVQFGLPILVFVILAAFMVEAVVAVGFSLIAAFVGMGIHLVIALTNRAPGRHRLTQRVRVK